MKQDTADAVGRTAILVGGAAAAWGLQEWSLVMAIAAGAVTALYGIINLAFLIRKWYRLEKSGWHSHDTERGGLDEQSRKDR